ncbi:Ldh family oxidoreductase [Bradyrhizobium sp. AS23.2]|uniref:Ldh family oxidoreductase n=1 Tax=Bradyrhizobium sp. AS23.2 TaxID=1680155 RepID=UPI00093F7A49|nr:Ldh family oxidoreductase [Bradyrhizobium sp. AS23.2]OKO66952.1 lactate dehydrogenase [Bradyrhizobium sp. AS23.2]
MRFTIEDAQTMARQTLIAVGASEALATSLANATVAAELSGRHSVGFSHLLDYLDSITAGRIIGSAQPEISFPTPAMIQVDARGGIAQLGFDLAIDELQKRAELYGIAVFSQSNSYSAGELGYYTRRLAKAGLVAVAATNGSAHVAAGKSTEAVYGTNPLSFAAPTENGPPLLIDQASSATAFVNVRRAAESGEPIPEGWAIDTEGRPTTDANEALKGALLAFGGDRGANIALFVEILAAGVTGANWSLDAPSFADGNRSPGAGLLVIALKPAILAPNFSTRLASHSARLAAKGIHIPGRKQSSLEIELPDSLVEAMSRYNKP